MSSNSQFKPHYFATYLDAISEPEHEVLLAIKAFNQQHRQGEMMLASDQIRLLVWLANLMGVKKYLEIGVFTGYSSTAMALSLPEEAKLYLCDINLTYTNIAQQFWQQAQVAQKMQLFLQPALISLSQFKQQGLIDYFDFVFIDADKLPTQQYLDACYPLLVKGGVVAIDNTFLHGKVADQADGHDSKSLKALRQFNKTIFKDERFVAIMLPLGDGLTLVYKK